MASLPAIAVRTGAGIVLGAVAASSVVGRVFKPVTDTIGTIGKTVAEGNEHTRRTAETRQLARKSNDLIERMSIETGQRKALIQYGNETADLNAQFSKLSEDAQRAIVEWQKQFPDVL